MLNTSRIAFGLSFLAIACGGTSEQQDSVDSVSTMESALVGDGACGADATGGGGWVNDAIGGSSGTFTIEFSAYPKAAGNYPPTVDAVIGLANGPASSFGALGPIVRFNAQGDIDARNGAAYGATQRVQYRSDYPYLFRVSVDVTAHTYSVWVKERTAQGTPLTQIADHFAFRTEQSAVTRLDTVGRFVDAPSGALSLCGMSFATP
jgi:hypothetical protein